MYKKCISIDAYQSSLTSLDFYYVQEMHIDRLDFTRLLLCKINAYRSMHYVQEMQSIVFDFTRLFVMYYVQEMHIDRL